LFILWGHSDDLLEVDGACRDEADAYDGTTVRLDAEGFLPINEDGTFQDDEPADIEECRTWVSRYDASVEVKAEWEPEGTDLTWRVSVVDDSIPCAAFIIREDGKPICQAVVVKMRRS